MGNRIRYTENQPINNGILFISDTEPSKRRTANLKCHCGNVFVNVIDGVKQGKVKSCGCINTNEARKKWSITHQMTNTSEYKSWCAIKARCYNTKNTRYNTYGGRGVRVCERWLSSFENFYADMGNRPTPQHSIDRIDVNGDYEPSNCRWATPKEQANNRTTSKWLTLGKITKTLSQWAEKTGLGAPTIRYRLKAGWGIKKTLYTPFGLKRKIRSFR